MTSGRTIPIKVTDPDGTVRVVDTRAKTLHFGKGMEKEAAVQVEPSKPMRRMTPVKQLMPSDHAAIRSINDGLAAYDVKLRLAKVAPGKGIGYSNKDIVFLEAEADEPERIRTIDYLWLGQKLKYAEPYQLAEHIIRLVTDTICGFRR